MNEKSSKVIFWALLLTYKSTLYLFREARFEHLKLWSRDTTQPNLANLGKTDPSFRKVGLRNLTWPNYADRSSKKVGLG